MVRHNLDSSVEFMKLVNGPIKGLCWKQKTISPYESYCEKPSVLIVDTFCSIADIPISEKFTFLNSIVTVYFCH
jgi:hypothetical protein